MISCPNCKKNFIDGTRFCTVCGANLIELAKKAAEEEERRKNDPIEKLKAIPKKMWAIGGCVAVVAIVVFVTIFSMLNSVSKDKYVVYLKDGELYLDMLNIQGPFAITDGLTKATSEDVALTYKDFYLNNLTEISNDGKTIFYPENMQKNLSFDLYYRSTSKFGAEGEKIAEAVAQYKVSPNGDFLIYKNHEGLFLYDFEDKDEICEELGECHISEDCRIVYYVTKGNDFYRWEKGKGSSIVAEAADPLYISKDFSTVYYNCSNGIYVSKNGQDAELISNLATYLQAYENGTMYYLKYETDTYYMSEYVVDDCLETDQELKHLAPPDYYTYPWPEKPENPTAEELEEYEEVYAKLYAQYEAEMDAYIAHEQKILEKEQRDVIREQIAKQTCVVERYALYYYDGEKSIKVHDDVAHAKGLTSYFVAGSDSESAAMYAQVYVRAEKPEAIHLSEIQDLPSEISIWKARLRTAETEHILWAEDKGTRTEIPAVYVVVFSKDGSKAYILSGSDNILYEMNFDGENWDRKIYDTNAYPVFALITPLENGSLMYFKDVEQLSEDKKATLYVDKNAIEKDVLYAQYSMGEDGAIYFIKDFEGEIGDLCCYKDGEVIEIDEDVYIRDFRVSDEGGVFYLKEYDPIENRGDLYYSINGEPGKCIDKEVSGIVKP